ncbi:MAG: TonB-dependent receptor [Bacteroidota bacterium]
MSSNILIAFCLLLSQTLLSQSAILSGTVRSGDEVLSFATVQLEPDNLNTLTDEAGRYEFRDLAAGDYQLSISYVGYLPFKQKVKVVDSQPQSIDLQLRPNAALKEVVVTATMKPTTVANSPVKIEVVKAKQLETFMPSAASSIVEGIQMVNGVQEVTACGVCYTNSISINGLEGAYTAVLMDGMPIYGNLSAVYGLNGIPNMIVDRFEVIRGPSSTLYGSEAVAGVINIITKDPKEQPIFEIDLMGTTHQEAFGNIAVAPRIGKASGYIGLNFAYMDGFSDQNEDGFSDNIHLDRYSLFTKWNIDRKSGKLFSIAGKYYYEDRRNGVEAFLEDRAYRDLRGDDVIYGESIFTNRAELFGSYEFDTNTSLKLDFSASHHLQDSYYGSDAYNATQQIVFSNLIWNLPTEKHDVLLGWTNRFQYYDDNTVATANESVNAPERQFISGVFVQDEWFVNKKLTLLSGIRLDHYTSHGLIPAPRLNLKYKPSDWTTLRTNFGTGFRIVNLFTEDHAFVSGQRSVEITESLNPEQSYNGSLSLNHVFALGSGSGTIDIESYYTYFTNKIIPDYDDPTKIIYANSEGNAQTKGIGATVNYSFRFPVGIQAGFNRQWTTQRELSDNGVLENSPIEFAPDWTGILLANYNWQKAKTVFAYTARWTGPMTLPEVFDLGSDGLPVSTPRAVRSPIFSLHNLQVTKEVSEQFSVYGGIQNLFDYRQIGSPLVGFNDPNAPLGFSDFFDTSYSYAPNQGREFYIGVKWNTGKR